MSQSEHVRLILSRMEVHKLESPRASRYTLSMAFDRILKKLFHWWFLFRRPMTLGVRVLVSNEDGHVLLVRHTYVSGWHLPGGGVERGETLEAAAEKELREETGFAAAAKLRLRSVHYNRSASPRDHVAVFICPTFEKLREFEPNREIAEIGFFSPDNLPQNIAAGTRRRIDELLLDKEPSPEW